MPRYLWAADRSAQAIPADRLVENRYHVISSQLWLDTKPEEPPGLILPLPSQALAYAQLHRYQLHLPQLHGFCTLQQAGTTAVVTLLENVPIDRDGNLLPSLAQVWRTATALEQAYWLWQIINLWAPLAGTGGLASLTAMDNIRVDGWRIRLCELLPDRSPGTAKVTLATLGTLWSQTFIEICPDLTQPLCALFTKMQSEKASLRYVAAELNRLVLERAAQLPLRWQIAGGTDAGANDHNEDSYYPTPVDLAQDKNEGRIAIVCDGVAGHDGGEVASQMAVKLLKLQAEILCADLARCQDIATPEQLCSAIAAMIRVVNNTLVERNQSQERSARQRMGTTMVMALQVNQQVSHARGVGDSHEIYIAHLGDSRAYWITPERCQLLTIDDDIATREVKQGRDLPWHSASRPDATVLTQALGLKAGEMIQPTVQRLMAIEDGILLLCSDGLSDRHFVECSWQHYARQIVYSGVPLEEAVRLWLNLAHQTNSDDNISLVLMSCQVSSPISQESSSEIVALSPSMSQIKPVKSRSKSLVSKMISACFFVAATFGSIAAIMMIVGTFGPEMTKPGSDSSVSIGG